MSVAAHPWMPVSPCGDRCLPPAGTVPVVGRMRLLLRITAAAAIVLVGVLIAAMLPLLHPAVRERVVRTWFRGLLGALRIRLEVKGGERFGPRGAGILVVSNHVSWLDMVALCAVQPLRMVAKQEVRSWPVIGPLARRAGTIFIPRERLSMLPRVVATVSDALVGGAAVGVFPEGTTWCGMASGRFRPAMFQAAAQTGTPVRPVALRYWLVGAGSPAGARTTIAAFVGSTTLWRAIVLLAGVRGLSVEVILLPLLAVDGSDRRALAVRADAAVTAASGPPVPAVSTPPLLAQPVSAAPASAAPALSASLSAP